MTPIPEDLPAGTTPPGRDAASERTPVARAAAPGGASDPRSARGPHSSSPSPSRPGVDDGEAREGEPGAVLRTGAGPSPETPAGEAPEPASASPAGSSGQEWRDRVKAATSALRAAQRAKRGRYTRKSAGQRFGPGMARRLPPEPPEGGAT